MDSHIIVMLSLVALYFVAILLIGYFATKRTQSTEDFLVAGRSLGVWVVAFATSASIISGWSFIGSSGLMYGTGWTLNVGIVLAGSGFGIPLCYILGARPLRVISQKFRVYTVPDALYAIYNSKSVGAMSAIGIFAGTLGYLTIQWVALGYIFSIALGTHYLWGLAAAVVIVGIYVVGGGALSSAWADFLQQLIMIGVALYVPFMVISRVGGFAEMNAQLAAISTKFVEYPGVTPLTYVGLFSFMFVFTMWSPHIVNKFYSAKNLAVLKWGALICAVTYIFCSAVSLSGVAGRVMVAQGTLSAPSAADEILPHLLMHTSGPILMGIILAAVLAATMSTISAFLLVGSSALVRDLWKHTGRKPMNSKQELMWLRVFTAIIVVTTGLLAVNPPKLIALIGAAAFGMFVATCAPQLILGMRWRRASTPAAIVATAVGLFLSVGMFILDTMYKFPIWKKFHMGGSAVIIVFVIMIVGSLLTPYKEKAIFEGFPFQQKQG